MTERERMRDEEALGGTWRMYFEDDPVRGGREACQHGHWI